MTVETRETYKEAPDMGRGAPSQIRVSADARKRDELEVFMAFGAFPLRNAVTRIGLVALWLGFLALPVLAYLYS